MPYFLRGIGHLGSVAAPEKCQEAAPYTIRMCEPGRWDCSVKADVCAYYKFTRY